MWTVENRRAYERTGLRSRSLIAPISGGNGSPNVRACFLKVRLRI